MYPGAAFEDGGGGGDGAMHAGDGAEEVIWELEGAQPADAGSQGAQGATSAAPPPAAAPAAPMTPAEQRIAALERQNAELSGQLQPYLNHLRRQVEQEQSRPPFDPSRIDTDPNIKPSDLLRLMEWQRQRDLAYLQAQTTATARTTLSEQTARGEFNPTAMGQGFDYDSIVGQYVSPLVSQNPAIEALIQQAAPGNPAAGRMVLGAIVKAIELAGDDLVGGLKAVFNALGAYKQGAQATAAAIGEQTRARAANVLTTAHAQPRSRRQSVTADQVWKMSNRDYDRMWDQLGR